MAQYFFHLRDGTDHILDPEGTELADLPAVQRHTMRCARDTLSNADFPVLQRAKRAFDRAHGNPLPNSTETGKTDNPPDPGVPLVGFVTFARHLGPDRSRF